MLFRHLAVVATNFAFSFQVKMLAFITNRLQPNQNLVHYSTLSKPDVELRRMRSILDLPRPLAVIGISIRPETSMIEAFKAAEIPVVLIDEQTDDASTVTTDNFAGGRLAAEHLLSRGKKHIAVVSGYTQIKGGFSNLQRLEGFKAGLATGGLTVAPDCLIEVLNYSYQEGHEAMTKWLKQKTIIDAVFSCAGDDCALGMLRAAQEHGVRIPADIAILGYDDMDTARLANPPLSTVRQPLQEMAETAYRLASNSGRDLVSHPKKAVLTPTLVVRAST